MRSKYFFSLVLVLCFSYIVFAGEIKTSLTLQDMIARFSKDWNVVQKQGEITEIRKDGEGWKVDYTISGMDVISGFMYLDISKNIIIKTDEKNNILYYLATVGALSTTRDMKYKDTVVLGAQVIGSWPGSVDISKVKTGEKVTLLFVSQKKEK